MHSILRHSATFFPAFQRLGAHGAHTLGSYHQTEIRLLESPVRRKGKYVNETFLRRKDAEEWGIHIEWRIDRQEPATTRKSHNVQLSGDLVALHRQDLGEVGKNIGRSRTPSPLVVSSDFAIATAMRQDEIARVKWRDFDASGRMLLIRIRKDPRKKKGNDQRILP